jgi:hypothetical protein
VFFIINRQVAIAMQAAIQTLLVQNAQELLPLGFRRGGNVVQHTGKHVGNHFGQRLVNPSSRALKLFSL